VNGVPLHLAIGQSAASVTMPVGGGYGVAQQKMPVNGMQVAADIPCDPGFDVLMITASATLPRTFKTGHKAFDKVCTILECSDPEKARVFLDDAGIRSAIAAFIPPGLSTIRRIARKQVTAAVFTYNWKRVVRVARDAAALAARLSERARQLSSLTNEAGSSTRTAREDARPPAATFLSGNGGRTSREPH
jgi:hypothetical protein